GLIVKENVPYDGFKYWHTLNVMQIKPKKFENNDQYLGDGGRLFIMKNIQAVLTQAQNMKVLGKLFPSCLKAIFILGPPKEDLQKIIDEERKDLAESMEKLSEENQRKIRALLPVVDQITRLEPNLRQLSDETLGHKTEEFKARFHRGEKVDNILPEAFAVVREAFMRLTGMRLYDVQMLGGIVLHQGKVAEIPTGEGKTFTAMLPAYLRGLNGQKVHIITQNDYLAKRDYKQTRKLYEFLNLTPGFIQEKGASMLYRRTNEAVRGVLIKILPSVLFMLIAGFALFSLTGPGIILHFGIVEGFSLKGVEAVIFGIAFSCAILLVFYLMWKIIKREILSKIGPSQKQKVYKEADVVFTTVNVGFDGMRHDLKLHNTFAIVDEVDYHFIDLNRTSLGMGYIIGKSRRDYLKAIAEQLSYDDDYCLNEHSVVITQKGEAKVKRSIEIMEERSDSIGKRLRKLIRKVLRSKLSLVEHLVEQRLKSLGEDTDSLELLSELEFIRAYLKVKLLYHIDYDYLVEGRVIKVIDKSTDRKKENCRYARGIHSLLELKENIVTKKFKHSISLPVPVFFTFYGELCGMSGTIDFPFARKELERIFNIKDVVGIPSRSPNIREDLPCKVFLTPEAQYKMMVSDALKMHYEGRPVLVGTRSIEESQQLSRMLKEAGINHKVLNAKNEKQEISIIHEAGKKGAITVATGMIGRGADIKLTKETESLGGLFVQLSGFSKVSVRIDRQFKGRGGRQGQPAQTQVYVNLSDYLTEEEYYRNLILGEDESVDLGKHPEIIEIIKSAQSYIEEQGYYHRLIQFMIDFIFYKQQEVMQKQNRRDEMFRYYFGRYYLWIENY
ncbi:MAG: hypothetical protein KAJ14_13215, partial [Candidatus Omnitrophica bacterium]|nr:hypothetical protein [Candidatus Omnitrophota bacterium]